mmetsp:Transcript_5733/g.9784  ORF Transcript_5733/g.9784 Transcript_5733/m.9784 type:complete len:115 (+) Transcript_5733:64-408(+)
MTTEAMYVSSGVVVIVTDDGNATGSDDYRQEEGSSLDNNNWHLEKEESTPGQEGDPFNNNLPSTNSLNNNAAAAPSTNTNTYDSNNVCWITSATTMCITYTVIYVHPCDDDDGR